MIFSFSDSINTRVDTRRPPKFPSNNKGGITKQSKRKLIEKLTGIHGFSKKRGMAINSSLFIQILLHVWTLLTYGKKIWISSLCVSVNIINFALNFDCSQQGICVKIRLYRITSIMIQNPAKNKKKKLGLTQTSETICSWTRTERPRAIKRGHPMETQSSKVTFRIIFLNDHDVESFNLYLKIPYTPILF